MKKIMFTGDNLSKDERNNYLKNGYQIDAYDVNLKNEEIINLIAKNKYDGYILGGDEILDENTINNFDNSLKVISFYGVGYQTYIDEKTATSKNIIITNTPGTNTNAVAEHTIALLLSATRNIVYNNNAIKKGVWSKEKLNDLCGLTIGIIGMGAIATQVAKKLYYCFKPKIMYYNRSRKPDLEKELDLNYVSLDELYQNCDAILIHCSATAETINMIDAKAFQKMKNDVILINTARASIVDENALFDALKQNKIKTAAFDVFYKEPVDFKHDKEYTRFAQFIGNKLIISPHTAYFSHQALEDMKNLAIQNCIDVLTKGTCKYIVNQANIDIIQSHGLDAKNTRIYILENEKYIETIKDEVARNINAKSIETANNVDDLMKIKSLKQSEDKKILMIYSDLIGEGEKIITQKLSKIKNLYAICYGCTYLDGLDLKWCKNHNIIVTTLDDFRVEQRAELMFYIIQSTINRIAYLMKNPNINNQNIFNGIDLHRLKVGFIGCTNITKVLAKKLQLFGMDISYYSEHIRCIDLQYKDIENLLKTSDIIITAGYTGFEQYKLDKFKDIIPNNAYIFSCEQGQQNVNRELFISLAENKKISGYGFTSSADKVTDFAENIYCISDNTWASADNYKKLCENWISDVKSALTTKSKNLAK